MSAPPTVFDTFWSAALARVEQHLQATAADPARSIVLLPFAQLLPVARQQWAASGRMGVMPRFETTQSWAQRLHPFAAGPQDITFDAALDLLTAQRLLVQTRSAANPPIGLESRLQEAAWQLAPLAAAQAPEQRAAWLAQMQQTLQTEPVAALHWEQLVTALALAWAGHASYASDALWQSLERNEVQVLVLVRGVHDDPLGLALAERLREQHPQTVCEIDWQEIIAASAQTPQPAADWHLCSDPEDEAQRAAACVQQAVQQQAASGKGLVALVDNNRALTRRIRALLAGQGLAMRDETGWKLSTTIAASHLMALLRACTPNASSDAVLAWLKLLAPITLPTEEGQHANTWLHAAEARLRRAEIAAWPGMGYWQRWEHPAAAWMQQMEELRRSLQAPRALAQWLVDVQQALQTSGQWAWLTQDAAGESVLTALHWQPGSTAPLADGRWTLATFSHWVSQLLEAATFHPAYPLQEQVAIVPSSQLLARPFAAVVMPGCDEQNLPASPEPPGFWSNTQRQRLGLPDRHRLQQAQRQAWQYLLTFPAVDLLASRNDGAADLQPSPLVLEWQCTPQQEASIPLRKLQTAPDPRKVRTLPVQLPAPPAPQGNKLPVQQLSASGYHHLRLCPYRFFALQLLPLNEANELTDDLDKRDFGNWLHRTLYLFHKDHAMGVAQDQEHLAQQLDLAAAQARQEQQLDDAAFLPFQCTWPRLRDAYLAWWQADHAETASRYIEGESRRERGMADLLAQTPPPDDAYDGSSADGPPYALQLRGTIDRMEHVTPKNENRQQTSDRACLRLIDYKTESEATTRKRISDPDEDTQLAFYALLLAPEEVQTAYLHLGEKGEVKLHVQSDAPQRAQRLLHTMAHDLRRIAQGAPLPALGEGSVCDYCPARGLCRRDFRHETVDAATGDAA
ncbi:MAG: PD-(D/E)XK nuclease family protein [Brachymonas sp.]|nr:PD-(D/E)XK nuclease family protein [Brachymonas sp.]